MSTNWIPSFCKHFGWEEDSEQIHEIKKLVQNVQRELIEAIPDSYESEPDEETGLSQYTYLGDLKAHLRKLTDTINNQDNERNQI
jgi:hypothetical protein